MKNVLLGQVCLDIYPRSGLVVPGCGILHNAYHLQQLGASPLLVTRIGRADANVFARFFEANQIVVLPESVAASGRSPSIKVHVTDSGEAIIANPVNGVWQNFRLTPEEETIVAQADHLHLVLVKNLHAEFSRLASNGRLTYPLASADLLDLRDFTPDLLARFLVHLDIAFIGWKGALDDDRLEKIRSLAALHRATVVVTLGAQGILVFDGSRSNQMTSRFFEVNPVDVQANTNGCGDAFIAYFLAEYWQSCNLEQAVERGKVGGRMATHWRFALPDTAYPDLLDFDPG